MPQEVFRQGNFTNGELDPKMLGRRELKAYFASLMGAENCLQSPQGPINRRPGHALVGGVRNPLNSVALTPAMMAAPNGGDLTHVVDGAGAGPVTTTALSTTNPYVILTIDLGAPTEVSAVDVVNVAVVASGGGATAYTPAPTPIVPYPTFPGGIDLSIP